MWNAMIGEDLNSRRVQISKCGENKRTHFWSRVARGNEVSGCWEDTLNNRETCLSFSPQSSTKEVKLKKKMQPCQYRFGFEIPKNELNLNSQGFLIPIKKNFADEEVIKSDFAYHMFCNVFLMQIISVHVFLLISSVGYIRYLFLSINY